MDYISMYPMRKTQIMDIITMTAARMERLITNQKNDLFCIQIRNIFWSKCLKMKAGSIKTIKLKQQDFYLLMIMILENIMKKTVA